MPRLFAALLAVNMLVPVAAAQAASERPAGRKDVAPQGGGKAPAAARPSTPATRPPAPQLSPAAPGAGAGDLDPAVREIVRREVERAKEEMRDEIRAEIQGAQSAREFMDTAVAGERRKLDFLQLNGYLRVRGDLFDNLDLRRDADPAGYYLFPRPLLAPKEHGTLTTGNMRFRLEPTLNVSEQVRVLAQVDFLDNLVLGSTPQGLFARSDGVAFPFDARSQVVPESGVNSDRSSVVVKRAWGEVQTPVGLLSFGRMASSWGLGILSHAGNDINDDLGDSVDRLQFALSPLKTPVGSLVLVPMWEMVATGVTSQDQKVARGLGQPFDRDMSDDAKAVGIKVVRADTPDEVKRKLERNESSLSYGAWYMYKSQSYEFTTWADANAIPSEGSTNQGNNDSVGTAVKRDAYAHVLDLWSRWQTKRFRLEGELAGVIGEIGNASTATNTITGPVLLRQFGGALQTEFTSGKLKFGGEVGFASGDKNPGMGNRPGRGTTTCGDASASCDIDGLQYRAGDRVLDMRNFRFNPAYRVDLILWREILQGVTDAFYLKPTFHWEVLEGLGLQAAVVYSQAMYAGSTPSGKYSPLGIELDLGVSYKSDDGFIAFVDYGILQPLDGLSYALRSGHPDLSRAHAIRTGLAIKF
jgi:uncharacterized protein (TIGR04551 family)